MIAASHSFWFVQVIYLFIYWRLTAPSSALCRCIRRKSAECKTATLPKRESQHTQTTLSTIMFKCVHALTWTNTAISIGVRTRTHTHTCMHTHTCTAPTHTLSLSFLPSAIYSLRSLYLSKGLAATATTIHIIESTLLPLPYIAHPLQTW